MSSAPKDAAAPKLRCADAWLCCGCGPAWPEEEPGCAGCGHQRCALSLPAELVTFVLAAPKQPTRAALSPAGRRQMLGVVGRVWALRPELRLSVITQLLLEGVPELRAKLAALHPPAAPLPPRHPPGVRLCHELVPGATTSERRYAGVVCLRQADHAPPCVPLQREAWALDAVDAAAAAAPLSEEKREGIRGVIANREASPPQGLNDTRCAYEAAHAHRTMLLAEVDRLRAQLAAVCR